MTCSLLNETFCILPQLASKNRSRSCDAMWSSNNGHLMTWVWASLNKTYKTQICFFLAFSMLWGHKSYSNIGSLFIFALTWANFVKSQKSWAAIRMWSRRGWKRPLAFSTATSLNTRGISSNVPFLSEWLTQWCWLSCNTRLGTPPHCGATRQWRGGGARLLRPTVVTTTEASYLSNK